MDGLDELNDRFKFADFTAVFLLQQKAVGDAEHFKAPNVFSSGDVTTADSPETMTVLPLGLTSALSLVCCQSPEAAGPETPHDVVSWMGVW